MWPFKLVLAHLQWVGCRSIRTSFKFNCMCVTKARYWRRSLGRIVLRHKATVSVGFFSFYFISKLKQQERKREKDWETRFPHDRLLPDRFLSSPVCVDRDFSLKKERWKLFESEWALVERSENCFKVCKIYNMLPSWFLFIFTQQCDDSRPPKLDSFIARSRSVLKDRKKSQPVMWMTFRMENWVRLDFLNFTI